MLLQPLSTTHTACCSLWSPRGLAKRTFHDSTQHRWCHRQRRERLTTSAAFQEVAGVLVVSAIPFLAVQALADSNLGKDLQSRLEADKGRLEAEQAELERQRAQARAESMWYGAERPKWLGPLEYEYPAWLGGKAPGDYGFDVAALSREADKFDRNFELELLHARWAMLGALGALVPEVLQYGGVTEFAEPRWWNVGYTKLQGEDLNYLGIAGFRIAGGQAILIIVIAQAMHFSNGLSRTILLMFGPEYARSCGIEALEPLGLYLPGDKNYPGGILFDPLGLSKDPTSFEDLKVKEIKNGRLAMVAWAGFFVQGTVTKKGPLENLLDFFADPGKNNILHLS